MIDPPAESAQSPVAAPRRIAALDTLRGVAICGILFANVGVLFGIVLMPPEQAASLPAPEVDRLVHGLERVLVEGKFYAIFSLLFGIGFGLQLGSRGQAAQDTFRRRLRILLGIGAVHAVFLWAGDILMLYALLGFTLPWFARRPEAVLLRWTVMLLAMPTGLYLLTFGLWSLTSSGAPAAFPDATAVPPEIMARLAAMGTGGPGDAFIGNLIMLVGRWLDLVVSVRFPKVLGMFVLGLWLVRRSLVFDLDAHRILLRRWRATGWGLGLPCNLVAAWAGTQWPYLPPSSGGLVAVVGQAVGFPLLALGYASTVSLLVMDRRPGVLALAPVGRMALTNYLMHSLVCVVLSYGFGFGLWWQVGWTGAMGIAAAVVLGQIPLSRWWLSRFQHGPAEWLWRRLTYRRPLAFRAAAEPRG